MEVGLQTRFCLAGRRPFAASQSRDTKPPHWRAKVVLGQDKQRKLPFRICMPFFLSCPSATFALQYGGFVSREWLAAKGLLPLLRRYIRCWSCSGGIELATSCSVVQLFTSSKLSVKLALFLDLC